MSRSIIVPILLFGATVTVSAKTGKVHTNSKSLSFIENKGQIVDQHGVSRSDIQYKLSASGLNVLIGDGKLHYQFTRRDAPQLDPGSSSKFLIEDYYSQIKITTYRLDVSLLGANKNATAIAEEPTGYYEQYYLPQSNNVKACSFGKITYKNVYPGIDWCLYVKDGKLEYDFIVHSGADAGAIRLKYEGVSDIKLNDNGSLTASSPFGSITENKPYSYIQETSKSINSSFSLHNNILSFKTGKSNNTIIIDPVLDWASYYGGNSEENAYRITKDNLGNIYMTGSTSSTANIATTGAHQQTNGGGACDAFLIKYNAAGQRQWSTYYGGSDLDIFESIAVNNLNEIIVTGQTGSSNNIATTGAYQTSLSGITDVVLAKFNASGQLQWATYFGGSSIDRAHGVTVDVLNNIYIAGQTNSNNNISTIGTFQYTSSLGSDAFIVKFNNAGQRIWGTYFGGNGVDQCYDITYDQGSHSLYTTGYTTSTNVFATLGTQQQNNLGQCAYIEKFDTTGQRVWGTYYGGGDFDRGDAICTDNLGNIYIGGSTRSTDSIGTPGVFQPEIAGGQFIGDAFIAKFNSSGIRLWGSYYGSEDNFDFGRGIICDNENNVWFVGNIPGTTLVGTQGSYQPINAGGTVDAFLVKFNPNGKRIYGTFYGGTDADDGFGLAMANNILYLGGNSRSTANIATTGSDQSIFGGGPYDAFLARFHMDTTVTIAEPFNDTSLCLGEQFTVDYSTSGTFQTGNTFTLQLSNATGSFATPVTIGSISSTVSGVVTGTVPVGTSPGLGYRIRIVSSNIPYTSYDNGTNIEVKQTPATPTAGSNSPVCSGTDLNLTGSSTTSGVSYAWTGPNTYASTTQNPTINNTTTAMSGDYIVTAQLNGCISLPDTATVIINTSSAAAASITANPGTNINIGQSVTFTANVTNGNSPSYQWRLNGNDQAGETNVTYTSNVLANNDIVSVMVHASGTCLIPDSVLSNQLTMSVTNGISEVNKESDINIYPNPNSGIFTITGLQSGKEVRIDILNISGQSIFSKSSQSKDQLEINLHKDILAGTYLLRLTYDTTERLIPFVLK